MFTDIVFPKGNELAFLEMAMRLRCKIVFAYDPFPTGAALTSLRHAYPTIPLAGIIGKNVPKADLILGLPEHVERKEANIIGDLEGNERKDGLHERKTALEHVLCIKAREKEKMLLIDFSLLLHAQESHGRDVQGSGGQALILGRMLQNAVHMRKYKNEAIIASLAHDPYEMRAGHDYLALLEELGYDGRQSKKIVENLTRFLDEKMHERTHERNNKL